MALPALCAAVRQRRGSAAERVSDDDCVRAIAQLRALGGGWDYLTIGTTRYVRSVPTELDGDATALLARAAVAAPRRGVLSAAAAARETGWSARRVSDALEALLAVRWPRMRAGWRAA
jgi:hypothetical protein